MTDTETMFEPLPLRHLEPASCIPTQWRSALGEEYYRGNSRRDRDRVRIRYGWSPHEAGDLANVPLRTVYDLQQRHVVEPTVIHDELPMKKPIYGCGDVLSLCLYADLRHAGIDTSTASAIAQDANELLSFDYDHTWTFENIARAFPTWGLPGTPEQLEQMRAAIDDSTFWLIDDDDPSDEDPEHATTYTYNAHARCQQLDDRAIEWWSHVGLNPGGRTPWM